MECMWFAFVSLSLIYLGVVANGFDHCNVHTTDTPVYPCRRDIVFVLDASTYMKTNENVERELDYVQQLISNWTFGADGVRVAFSGYGFDGDISFSLYYTSIAQCNKKIAAFRKKLHASGLSDYKLTDVLENIQQVYGGDGFDQRLFRHRAGVEPRFIVFSSTSDSEDIENSAPYFQTLYNNKYGTVLCVDLAATNLYSEIKTLRTVDMKGYAADLKILGKEVVNAICLHDDRITPAPCTTTTSPSTTAAPTTPPPLSTTTSFYRNRQESQCSCTLSNLWLDIVIAIDTSESMSESGLRGVLAFLATWIPQTTVDPSRNQSIRIGLVTFDTGAHILADLNSFSSIPEVISALEQIEVTNRREFGVNIEELIPNCERVPNVKSSFRALRLSEDVFLHSDLRENAKNVILLISSAYEAAGVHDPRRTAEQLKASGISIVTVSYEQEDETSIVNGLGNLASREMAYKSSDANLILKITETFCWINCYCKSGWVAYKSDLHAETRTGECVFFSDIDANWFSASNIACPQMGGGHLVDVFSRQKHQFLLEVARNSTTRTGPIEYFIGLSYNHDGYYWIPTNSSTTQPKLRGYQPWNPGYPNQGFGKCVMSTIYAGFAVGWRNIDCYTESQRYFCQAPICDTNNYCASADV